MLRSETAAQPERLAKALEGLRAYQQATRHPGPPPMPAVAEARGAALRDYGGSGPPLVVIPSLINPPGVLDLPGDRSLLRWLATQGRWVLLLDWGEDMRRREDLSVAGHVEEIAVPMIRALGKRAAVAGYCLGGTMAVAAAALAGAERLVTIAGPWHFSGYSVEARKALGTLWSRSGEMIDRFGCLPMEALQSAFWRLDPARTVTKFEEFGTFPPGSRKAREFVVLEDWANDGPPIPAAAARELFEDMYGADLPGRGLWRVGGTQIDPDALPCPILNIVSTSDRIVPHESAMSAGERLDLKLGHVGMIVGRGAKKALWEPLAGWLSQ